ncbi:hypothetical protein AC578_3470 [Pseudocercospora eumusae]|uniref:JmjC domain-containing protein n=1 Tax=Pseudocercospora eumusae TaxID=321146 RepID=A0A139HR24_9PEZI|nr:hypothetical protein AC578_3470 [Pseudocercospora eumusae]
MALSKRTFTGNGPEALDFLVTTACCELSAPLKKRTDGAGSPLIAHNMNSSPTQEARLAMEPRWPLGMPTAAANGSVQIPAHQDVYARMQQTFMPTYENAPARMRPGPNVHPPPRPLPRPQPWHQVAHAQAAPAPQEHFYSSASHPYPPASAAGWPQNAHYEPLGYTSLPHPHQQRFDGHAPRYHQVAPRIVDIAQPSPTPRDLVTRHTSAQIFEPETLFYYRPPNIQQAERESELSPLSQFFETARQPGRSPRRSPGAQVEGKESKRSPPKRKLIIKLPKRPLEDSASDCIKVAKRPRAEGESSPSRPGADNNCMQEPVGNEATPESNVASPDRRQPQYIPQPSPSTPREGAEATSHEDVRRASASSDGNAVSESTASIDVTESTATPETSPEDMARTRQMPTPPSEKEDGTPKTPRISRDQGDLQFSPRLYGREQPKRAAKKKYQDVATPPKAKKASKIIPRGPESASNVGDGQWDGVSDVQSIETRSTKRRPAGDDKGRLLPSTRSHSTPNVKPPKQSTSASDPATYPTRHPTYNDYGTHAPVRDKHSADRYVEAVIKSCEAHLRDTRTQTVYSTSAYRIAELLKKAKFASEREAKFLSRDEAQMETSANKFFNGPIVTEGQQTLPLQSVEQFLGEYYEPDAKIHIQDSSVKVGKNFIAVRPVRVEQVKERLLGTHPKSKQLPWNCLELATHHSDGLRPSFLQNEDCRLLTKLKIPDSADEARRKTYEQGYKEIETWALLAEAGALTEPHQDSHGYSTFITVNQGEVGFGFLSHPTVEEREGWRKHPQQFTGGKWRYIVLKPGQTVYFPAGTVHMVFRLPSAGHTLAFGGHVLRCSNIVHWAKTLIEERNHPNVTNEDLLDSSSGYLARVERFVTRAMENGTAEKWGGNASIAEFLTLKKEFLRKRQKQKRH